MFSLVFSILGPQSFYGPASCQPSKGKKREGNLPLPQCFCVEVHKIWFFASLTSSGTVVVGYDGL